MTDDLAGRLHDYVNGLFVREDEVLTFVREQTAIHDLPQINLQPHEARLLQLLVLLCGARKVVEVGTLAGYSAIWMARALPDDGRLVTIDNSAKHVRIARSHIQRAGLEDKITVLQGEGRQILQKLASRRALRSALRRCRQNQLSALLGLGGRKPACGRGDSRA